MDLSFSALVNLSNLQFIYLPCSILPCPCSISLTSPRGGYSGFSVTYNRLKQLFVWKGMKTDVHNFVKHCQVCLQSKPDRACYLGKLQPLSVQTEAWETISLDFIKGLPRSSNASCILVIMDKFIKYTHCWDLKVEGY
jgi:hypothetical protein